ncbi:sugar phosphate isomerase/epimerase family protein [Fimbriiglobus ruber]|uniref:D-tagatose 3-epimerase n=1 Tax=Fimbriiglobus ruber TaxID=1908690 RepID=A0A225DCK2_9BACT|nr:sugar phosphate isomerase/epimerase [Fimbriiglobus ruber]OWK36268.1 D-tagatose 3-epimerase [Fimbriiglobus ruber]
MKIGMNLLLWTGFVTEADFPTMAKIKAAGFDGVELPLFDGNADHYKTVRAELDRLGLACSTVTVMTPEMNPISPDAAVREKAVERLKWAVEMNHVLGSFAMCGPFHSPLGVFSGTGPTADEKGRAADVLRKAAEFAKDAKLTLAIEYLNRFECYFLTTAVDAKALVESVGHPNFRCMYDTFHAHIEEKSQASAVKTVEKVFAHVHISENDRGTPGTGQVRWDEAFKAIRQTGYDGWFVIEAFGRALPDLAAATRVWRDLFPTPDEVYTKGIQFIKEKWAAAA